MKKRALIGLALMVLFLVILRAVVTQEEPDRPNDAPEAIATESNQARADPSTIRLPNLTRPAAEPTEQSSAAQVYGDAKLPLGERFRLLLKRADLGNQAAAHLALGIANGCNAINGMEPGTPPVGAEKATDYQRLIDKQLRDECREVLLNPAYQKTINALRKHTANMYSESVKQAIRKAFADGGASAGLVAGLAALKSRPDEATAGVVAAQFSELEISSVYLAPLMRSVGSADPKIRDELVSRAIGFLACDLGRPCGPTSFDVGMTCLTFGACIPGADLQTVLTQELMTGQDVRDMRAILDKLRQIGR